MQRAAKIFVMIVRLLALVSIILGICLWTGRFSANSQTLVMVHFLFGFLTVSMILALGIVAVLSGLIISGLVAIVFAVLLPVTGFTQIATIGPHFGAPQIGHIIVVLASLGIAEMSAGLIRRKQA